MSTAPDCHATQSLSHCSCKVTNPIRDSKDESDRYSPKEAVETDGFHPDCGDTTALPAIGFSTKLARQYRGLEVRRDAFGHMSEDTFPGILGGIHIGRHHVIRKPQLLVDLPETIQT